MWPAGPQTKSQLARWEPVCSCWADRACPPHPSSGQEAWGLGQGLARPAGGARVPAWFQGPGAGPALPGEGRGKGSPAATAGHRSLGVPGPFGAELLEQSPSIALGPHGGLLQCPPQSPGLSRPARRGAGGARGVPRLQLRRVVWAARPLPCARPCLLLRLFRMQSRSQLAGHLDAGSSARPGRDAGGKPRAPCGLARAGSCRPCRGQGLAAGGPSRRALRTEMLGQCLGL